MENNINDIVNDLSFPTEGKVLLKTVGNIQLGTVLQKEGLNREYVMLPSEHLLPDGEYDCNLFEDVFIAANYVQEGQPVNAISNEHYIKIKSTN